MSANQRAARRIVVMPTRADLVDGAFLAVLCIASLFGFRTTYSGSAYLFVGVAGLLIGLVIGHLANVLGQPMVTVAAMTVAVFFLLGGALSFRTQAVGGVLPTAGTVRGLASVSIHGWKQLLTTLPPVGGTGPLLAIPYILGLMSGAGGLTMARRLRYPAAPLIAPLALLAAVILLGTARPAARLEQGVVFAVVAIVWVSLRSQRLRPPVQNGSGRRGRVATAAVLVAVAAVGATFVGPDLPGSGQRRVVLRSYVTPPFDLNAYPSPLVGFHKYTKGANEDYSLPLFQVTRSSGLPSGTMIRIATLDDYDGTVWGATSGTVPTGAGQPLDSFQRVGSRITTNATGKKATVTVSFDAADAAYTNSLDVNAWLPMVGTATSVSFSGPDRAALSSSFRYNLATNSGIVASRLQAGDSYTFTTVLAPAHTVSKGDSPGGTPTVQPADYAVVSAKAATWAKGVTGVVAEVLAVAAQLSNVGAYSDGCDSSDSAGCGDQTVSQPGHSVARLASFLAGTQPVGDDEQYAAAFALMSNSLGLPARVVLGAHPESNGTVYGKDVHAWVEVELAGQGWVAIPTSTFMSQKKPITQQQVTNPRSAAQVVPPPNVTHPPSTIDQAGLALSAVAQQPAKHNSKTGGWVIPGFVITAGRYGGPPVLLILLVCLTITGLKATRRRRRRTRGSPATRLAHGWHEIVDYARDLGATIPAGRTRREQAELLRAHDVAHLAFAADAGVFGPQDPADADAAQFWAKVDEARQAMRAQVGRFRRWRAALSLRSLRRRPHGGPAAAQ